MDARYKIAEAMMRGVGQPMAAFPDQRQDDDMALRGMASDLYQADQKRAQDYRAGIKEAILQSWPAELAKSAYGAVTLPGDVYAGKVNPMSDEAVGRAAEFAGLMTLGAGAVPAGRNEMRMGLKYTQAPDGVEIKSLSPSYLVAKKGGQEIGQISLSEKHPFVSLIQVDPKHRGQGVGSALYSEAEKALGKDLVPSPLGLSDDAKKFWQKQLSQMPDNEAQSLIQRSRQIGMSYGIKPEHIEDRLGNLLRKYGVATAAALPAAALAELGMSREEAKRSF
jgi:GNAT superfamily N-acetyltransferase